VVHGAKGAKRKNSDNEPLQNGADNEPLQNGADNEPLQNGADNGSAKPVPLLAALHIRIGDYVRYPAHHPILPVGYYEAALRKRLADLQLNGGAGRVLIFSEADDRARVEEEYVGFLRRAFPEICYEHVSDRGVMSDGEEMLLMSCCPAIIMANSSFSWWAAWIATRLSEEPVPVYYPASWFGEALEGNDTRDMFPAEWHSIPARCSRI
jgi:hypothetical protein